MDEANRAARSAEVTPVPRVVTATVAPGRGSVQDDVAAIVVDAVDAARLTFVRNVSVNREKQFIQELVLHLANRNEADAIILVGGVGIGPRDYTCEAVDGIVHRRLEGFGEAYRQLLRDQLGAGADASLQRAAAGVYNKCLVFALPRQPEPVRQAMRLLVIPTLREAMRIATGRRA
jgi:molybdenum cofactor biosynthesis protein B